MLRGYQLGFGHLGLRSVLVRVLAMGLVLFAISLESAARAEDNHWGMFGFDSENTFSNAEEDQLRPPLKLAWRRESKTSLDSVTVASGKVLVSGTGRVSANVVTCFDSNDGAVLWSFELPGGGRGAMAVSPAIHDGKVMFGGQSDDGLYALDLESGQLIWQIEGMKRGMFSNSPKLNRDSLIINANGGPIAKIDTSNGDMTWRSDVVGRQGTLAISNDLVFVTRIVPNAQPIIALDWATGDLRWTAPLNCASCVTVGGDLVFATGWDDENLKVNRLVALHAKDGKIAWDTQFEVDLNYSRMTLLDGVLFVSSGSREEPSTLYAVDPNTGAIMKRRDELSRVGRLVSGNGFVYVVMYREGVHAISPETLKTVWQAPMPGCRDCVIANGKLFVTSGRDLLCFTNEDQVR